MKCPRCQQDNPSHAKFCLECGTPVRGTAPTATSYVDLKDEVESLKRSLGEAVEQQTATSEILRVISRSPTDVQPVFDAIASSALRLCDGIASFVFRHDGTLIHLVAVDSVKGVDLQPLRHIFPAPPEQVTFVGRVVATARLLYIADIEHDRDAPPGLVEFARANGFRSIFAAPMLRDGHTIGAIAVTHRNVDGFTPKQGTLLQTFADQAVIAIENVRLFNETKEALEQQTATSEILRVIASSPTNAQPVFEMIAERAMQLCEAETGAVFMTDGVRIHAIAYRHSHMPEPEAREVMDRAYPRPLDRDSVIGQAILDRAVRNVPDLEALLLGTRVVIRPLGIRSQLSVPLLHEGRPIGGISVSRGVVGLFSDRHVALLQTFADQAVIAIENVRLFKELEARNKDLTEALEQQTATSEILRVISQSPTDAQPVFDTIVRFAVRLCSAGHGTVFRFDGELLHLVAAYNVSGEPLEQFQNSFPRPVAEAGGLREVIGSGRVLRFGHVEEGTDFSSEARSMFRALGVRSGLAVPMSHRDRVVGAIALTDREANAFTEAHVELLKTFADQAVIAIDNVRLFKELEARNRDLTATSEILRVIASSPTDLQPVFDAIAERSMRLCEATFGWVMVFDGELIHLRSLANVSPEGADALRRMFPVAPSRGSLAGRTILTGAVVHVPDVFDDPEYEFKGTAQATNVRRCLTIPLLHQERATGVIAVARPEPGTFSGEQIQLLQTFADQAVIAIENVRLFTELQEKNQALTRAHAQVTEALDQQTTTSEILRVISRSPTDVQPVFDTIVESAVRLCDAVQSNVQLFDGELMHWGAQQGIGREAMESIRRIYPMRPDRSQTASRAVLTRSVVQVPNVLDDPEYRHELALEGGCRSVLSVPMMREGEPIGAITVTRLTPGAFSETQTALLQTFADQAVIAIENVRLFTELQARTEELTRSVDQLTALGEVGQAISSTLDLQTVLRTIVARATQLAGVDAGVIYEYDEQTEIFVPRATERLEAEIVETLIAAPVRKGEGATGRLAEAQEPIQLSDILEAPAESRVRETLGRAGYRALLAVPLVREGHLIGGLTVFRKTPGEFAPEVIDLLRTFATQSALAIQNARLFREVADKSRQLEVASQHKSEFLANMSHELRTPLNAIIGFSEVLSEGMFGGINEKQAEYLRDILESGQHLLSLINDILDLSKIEAGRMELELTDFDLPTAIDNALTLVRERAGRRGIALHMKVDNRLGQIQADERKIRQVVLNLLSNAIKFTPEGGRIEVAAAPRDGLIEVAVSDTGVGIAPEDQEAIFEEFRQVGTAAKKVEGTGLGLALSRKFIELHGGRIWVKSQVGAGSTFTFTLPVRDDE